MSEEEKIAIVTGATRGIGKAIATRLSADGYFVVGTSTSESGAESISSHFSEQKTPGCGLQLDVCEAQNVTDFVRQVVQQYGAPVVLINNAGITQDNIFMRMKPEQWDQVINTNLSSVYRMTKACIRYMVKSRWGRVVNIGSVVASMGNPGQANYCAAKAGMEGFTKSLANEYASYGMTFNTVAPGFINTDMTDSLTEEQRTSLLAKIPMQTIGEPSDIAAAVAFLVSEQSRYITGQTLHVNGGIFMG
jgi:3-oxoacyl-[acyl-carrier protein] reductase